MSTARGPRRTVVDCLARRLRSHEFRRRYRLRQVQGVMRLQQSRRSESHLPTRQSSELRASDCDDGLTREEMHLAKLQQLKAGLMQTCSPAACRCAVATHRKRRRSQRMSEYLHVEKPFLDQLARAGLDGDRPGARAYPDRSGDEPARRASANGHPARGVPRRRARASTCTDDGAALAHRPAARRPARPDPPPARPHAARGQRGRPGCCCSRRRWT